MSPVAFRRTTVVESMILLWVAAVCASLQGGAMALTSTNFAASASASSVTGSNSYNTVPMATSTSTSTTLIANANKSSNKKNSRSKTTLLRASSLSKDLGIVDETVADASQPEMSDDDDEINGIIPITVISGFLGSGKTTLLQHLLENKSGDCPVGVIVNDVADVNIDGKLVNMMDESSSSSSSDGLVELENGCACCALSDELLNGVSELVTLSDLRRSNGKDGPNGHLKPFKHIVVEMSGVSDPRNIRATFQEAEQAGMVLMDRIRLDTMVTVVDAEMFESYFQSSKSASRKQSPELFRKEDVLEMEDWMEDVPPELLKAILGHRGIDEEGSNGVADLLVGQTETADVILLNKCDLLRDSDSNDNDSDSNDNDTNHKVRRLRELVKALNPRPTTTILETSYGKVPLSSILGVAKGNGVTISGAVDDHREFINAAAGVIEEQNEEETTTTVVAVEGCGDPSCSECGDDDETVTSPPVAEAAEMAIGNNGGCTDPACSDPACIDETNTPPDSHEHSHHDHAAPAPVQTESKPTTQTSSGCTDPACSDPACTEPSNDHDHSSSASTTKDVACNDPGCTEDHDHSHSHNESNSNPDVACNDPGCTEDHDHSHSHNDSNSNNSHDHSHSHSHEENSTHAGIGTFVYRARRPFHPQRMVSFLRALPISRGIPEADDKSSKETAMLIGGGDNTDTNAAKETLESCLRSKGFVWCADSHSNSMYWSHAGASFEYKCLGRWWATLPRDQWPEGVEEYVLRDFDDVHHPSEGIEGAIQSANSVGDRRQEVVFIGLGFGQASKQRNIRETLDKCLLSDEEYKAYQSVCFDQTEATGDPDGLLQDQFPTAVESEYMNY